ncbi:hypothetical protein [Marinigracilibium pacificum]|uniref:Lipocalin-like protein n=1 Tax=Marinigracilibium pacificum TaxID=2729599 RepID=A0A848IZ43_9BACT|nr:hypothetical protein [Marinigracilibium pacificum]NMM48555.1 hypothetical protein [Marinigracilibium pacificum]
MKPYLLLLAVLIISSCSKSQNTPEINRQIIGTWVWVQSSGGIDGRVDTPEKNGHDILLEISETKIKTFINDNIESIQDYHISIEEVMEGGTKEVIIYDDGNYQKQSIYFKGDSLILIDQCIDCFNHVYKKNTN